MKHKKTFAGLCAALLAGCEAGQSFEPARLLEAEPAPLAASEPPVEVATLSPTLSGPVTRVRDGDTIEVAGVAVRLNGLHCPEYVTSRGIVATRAMRRLVAGATAACELTGEVTHNRQVGRCVVGGADLAETLIRNGVCARCARYDPEERYMEAQSDAGSWPRTTPRYCY